MKEESELKNQPDEIDLDKNSKNFRNLDRPTPPVETKTAEEMAMEWANKEGYEHPSPYYSFLAGYEAAQFTPSAKSVEVEEADDLNKIAWLYAEKWPTGYKNTGQ